MTARLDLEETPLKAPRFFWRLIRIGPRLAYAAGLGRIVGRFVLLLTTRGRRSGLGRVTTLVYEERDGEYFVASARGPSADWLYNIRADPRVHVRVGGRAFDGRARIITDPTKIAEYLEHQLARNPHVFGAILRSEGVSAKPTRIELEAFALKRPMVVLRPEA